MVLATEERGGCLVLAASNPDQPGLNLTLTIDRPGLRGPHCGSDGTVTRVVLALGENDFMGQTAVAKCCL